MDEQIGEQYIVCAEPEQSLWTVYIILLQTMNGYCCHGRNISSNEHARYLFIYLHL